MEECFIFTHCGNFQALKVCDLKFSNVSQLCDLKNQIIKVGIYIEKYDRWRNEKYLEISTRRLAINTEFFLAFYKSNS
jgi:predicted TIM-barrel fold metal-dependent hydrolase